MELRFNCVDIVRFGPKVRHGFKTRLKGWGFHMPGTFPYPMWMSQF